MLLWLKLAHIVTILSSCDKMLSILEVTFFCFFSDHQFITWCLLAVCGRELYLITCLFIDMD